MVLLLLMLFYYINNNLFMLRTKINFVVICLTYLTFCFCFVESSFLHLRKVLYSLLEPQNPSLILRKTSAIGRGASSQDPPSPLQKDPGPHTRQVCEAVTATGAVRETWLSAVCCPGEIKNYGNLSDEWISVNN